MCRVIIGFKGDFGVIFGVNVCMCGVIFGVTGCMCGVIVGVKR